MRPYLITSIAGGGVVLISYAGLVLEILKARDLPSVWESARTTLFAVIAISFIVDTAGLL